MCQALGPAGECLRSSFTSITGWDPRVQPTPDSFWSDRQPESDPVLGAIENIVLPLAMGAAIGGIGSLGAVAAAPVSTIPATAAAVEGDTMFDWLSNAWSTVTGIFSSEPELELGGGFDPGAPDIYTGGGFGGGGDIWPEVAQLGQLGLQVLGEPGAPVSPTMGTIPRAGGALLGGAAAMGGITLAAALGGAGRAATFMINGIRGTMPQLWRYTRKYGAAAVANALGITVGALGAMLLSAPDAGRRRRRRGISARDIRTTKRVVGFVSKMAHDIGCVRAPRHFTRRRAR